MLGVTYRNAHARVAALAAGLSGEQLLIAVPATPGWTVHQLLAHLVGGAADAANGRSDGAPGAQWTARHVAEREHRPVAELLAEWEPAARIVESTFSPEQLYGPNLAADIICHESDLREALGLPRADRTDWQPFLEVMMLRLGNGLPHNVTLTIRDDQGQQWCHGTGDVSVRVQADGYELLRAAYSRRSRRQIAAWSWVPEPDHRLIRSFGVFGARDDDQPIPAE